MEPRRVYRLVCTDPPTDADFDSVRAEHPDRHPFRPALKECRARGLSVHATRASAEHCRRSTSKLSERRICLVHLEPGAGYIERNSGEGALHVVAAGRFRHPAEMRGGGGDG